MKQFLWLGVVAFLFAILPGCGDVFRPIIIPNPPVFPNPEAAHTVVTIGDNGDVTSGSAMVIDVTGDSVVSIKNIAIHPVHMVQQTASQVLALNQAKTGFPPPQSGCLVESNGQVYNVCPSLTKLTFSGTIISTTTTITLPASSAASFVAVAPNDTKAYVTLPAYVPDPINHPNDDAVAVIDTTLNAVSSIFAVGNDPEALAVTPDASKVYVANKGDGTLSAFNTKDLSARTITGSLSSPPIWLSSRSDSQRVYVLEQNGTLAWLDTHITAGPDTLTETGISVLGATNMWYDMILNRLYIPWMNRTTVVDVSQAEPLTLSTVQITPVSASQRTQGDVCSTFTPTAVTAAAVTSLPDASRAYVGSFAGFEVDVNISRATVNGTNGTTTYTYSLQPPATIDLLPGMVITISGVTSSSGNIPSDFDGTFSILSVGGGMFQVANVPTDTYVSGGIGAAPNVCPQVTVMDASNFSVKPPIVVPGVPGDPFCADPTRTRFRWNMVAAGDSTRAYLSSCDGGNVNFIDTSTDTYLLNTVAPPSARQPIPPSQQNPPQSPVFMIAGP